MTHAYPSLFSPIRIGGLLVRNRVVSSSHGERMSEDGLISDREIAYYEAKARGGTGLIVLDGVRISMDTAPNRHTILGGDPRQLPRYRALADAVHRHGAAIFGQLLHQGAQTGTAYSRRSLVSASAIASPAIREIPHALTIGEIQRVIGDFAISARAMRDGGLDGIELHAAHGYLIGQFLSPRTNQRTDAYGGDFAARLRFGREVVRAVRDAVGPGFPFGIRVNADDMQADGCSRQDMLTITKALVDEGRLDVVSVSTGTYAGEGISAFVGDFGYAPGFLAANAREFRDVLAGIPVMTVGRITTPELAESIIASNTADLCAMTRAIIADPDWCRKAQAGTAERIRPCIACNTCLTMNRAVMPITCSVNAACGEEREHDLKLQTPAPTFRRVLVIGGGVAGLEAARVAAERGHAVLLIERAPEIGGQVWELSRTKHRAEIGRLVEYYRGELNRLGVEIRTDVMATPESVRREAADCIIVATGARDLASPSPAWTGRVLDARSALRETTNARRAVVVDRDYGYGLTSVAHALRDRGLSVHIVTDHPMIGADLPPGALPGVLARLRKAEIVIHPLSTLAEYRDFTARLRNILDGRTDVIDNMDLVVVVGERQAEDALFSALESGDTPVTLIGDARAPRQIWQAVREGFLAGLAAG